MVAISITLTTKSPSFRQDMALCFDDFASIIASLVMGVRSLKQSAMTFLNNGGKTVNAMAIAIEILEDDQNINVGYENNLTVDRVVECCLMEW